MRLIRGAVVVGGALALLLSVAVWGKPAKAQTFQTLGSASLSVTTSTDRVALPAGQSGNNLTILNVGLSEVFVNFGASTVTAATTNESVPAGSARCFARGNATYVAAITASSTSTIRVSQGSGPCAISFRGGGSAGAASSGEVLFSNAGSIDGISGWTTNGTTALTGGAGTTVVVGASVAIAGCTIGTDEFCVNGQTSLAALTTTGAVTATLATDATHTTRTVCQDTTSSVLFFGSGALGICLGTSSARYKTGIAPAHDGLDMILGLEPVGFRYRRGYGDDGVKQQIGFLAEDVARVAPRFVDFDKEGRPNSIDWAGLIPVIVNAIKELKADNDNMRRELHRIGSLPAK